MQQWEIKSHWVLIDVELLRDEQGEHRYITFMSLRKEHFQRAWAEAELLANDGWELVSVAPSQSGFGGSYLPVPNDNSPPELDHGRLGQSYGYGGSYTSGHLLVFKRPKP
jgi:hypothetical protein